MPVPFDRIVFLDRDGTINVDSGYISAPEQVELIPGSPEALKMLRMYYAIAVVTNQSGISRGFYGHEDVEKVNSRLIELLKNEGAEFDSIVHCPHQSKDNCDCRKPRTGLLHKSVIDLHGKNMLTHSDDTPFKSIWMVGDRSSDIEAGNLFGAKTILLPEPDDAPPLAREPDYRARNLLEAVKIILREDNLADYV